MIFTPAHMAGSPLFSGLDADSQLIAVEQLSPHHDKR
jgi:hypothetical protein